MNRKQRKPQPRRAQLSLEMAILIAIVAVIAIIVGFVYMTGASKTNVGTSDQLLAVGLAPGNTIVIAFNKPLPTSMSLSPGPTLTSSAGSIQLGITQTNLASPTYVDNYPEYTFSETTTGTAPSPGNVIVSFQYTNNAGQTISILPAGNVTAQAVSANVVTPQ